MRAFLFAYLAATLTIAGSRSEAQTLEWISPEMRAAMVAEFCRAATSARQCAEANTSSAPLFTRNDLVGPAELFRLSATGRQPVPGQVMVLLPVADVERLAALLRQMATQ